MYTYGALLLRKYSKDYLVNLYKQNLGVGSVFKKMSKVLGCSVTTLRLMFERTFGVKTPNPRSRGQKLTTTDSDYTDIDLIRQKSKWIDTVRKYSKEELIELYLATLDVHVLASFLGCNYSTLNRVLHYYKLNANKLYSFAYTLGLWDNARTGVKRTKKERLQQSKTRKQKIKSGEIDVSGNLKAMRKAYKPVYTNTTIEVLLQEELKKRNVPFITQRRIDWKGGFCHPDIFIEPNICIFADGDYWHRIPKELSRAKHLNKCLDSLGYKVYRFWEKDIREDTGKCVNQVAGVHDELH